MRACAGAISRRLRLSAPLLSLAATLLGGHVLVPHHNGQSHEGAAHLQAVAASLKRAPYRLGQWVGRDVPLPEAAVAMLRPSAVLSRQYVHLEHRDEVDVIVIFCADWRDMLGHYPPVCYPSHGWDFLERETGRRGRPIELEVGGRTIDATCYEFVRASGWNDQSHIRVFSFFILPDGGVTRDIDEVHKHLQWLRPGTPGGAQVQVLTRASLSLVEAKHAVAEVMAGISQTFELFGVSHYGQPDEQG